MHQMITLPNGVRLLTQKVPAVRTAAVGVYIGTGSRYETAAENGAAHFLEHMAFKSTLNRSTQDIARQIDRLGGHVNAYTTKETTCFYARCLDSHLSQTIDLLSDMLLCPAFRQEEVDTERGVILEEIGMYRDTPEDLVSERLNAAVYKGSSLARPILGTARSLSGMDSASLRAYHQSHYCPERTVLSLAGSFSDADVELLKARFGTLVPGPHRSFKNAVFHPSVTVKRKATEQNHIILAFPALSYMDERRFQLNLLSSLLGGGVSSRLFQQVREERGLCYTVYSYLSDHRDCGLIGLYAALSPSTEKEALSTMCCIVRDLAQDGPQADELDRARDQAKTSLLMGLESTRARMSHMGSSMLLRGEILSPDELIAGYDAVTPEQVRQLAGELFRFDRAALSAVGRVDTAEAYQSFLSSF